MKEIKAFEKDLQKYTKLRKTDTRAVSAYEFSTVKNHEAVSEYVKIAKEEGIESAIYYSLQAARKVGFIQGVRYAENRQKRAKTKEIKDDPAKCADQVHIDQSRKQEVKEK